MWVIGGSPDATATLSVGFRSMPSSSAPSTVNPRPQTNDQTDAEAADERRRESTLQKRSGRDPDMRRQRGNAAEEDRHSPE